MRLLDSNALVPRVDVLGVQVSALNMDRTLDVLDYWITTGARQYVCVTGVHGVMESHRDETLRRIHNDAGLVTPDGMPMVWWARAHGHAHVRQVCGPDLMLTLCDRSLTAGYRHFFYGGGDGVADLLAHRLVTRFPGLVVAGTYTPPFRPLTREEDADVIARINDSGADILWVGLSTPKQEHWMAEHLGRLDVPVMIGVGAAFDFHAGLKRRAPQWMRPIGLEWLFRMSTEPRRLWKRYLKNNPAFVLLTLQTIWRAKRPTRPRRDATQPAARPAA